MRIRRATIADAKTLFAWRNDEEARANFRNPNPVSWEEHKDWIKRVVDPGNAETYCLIAEDARGPIGVIRFMSRDHDNFEVAINIAPDRRGEGLGGRFLTKACADRNGFLVAEIKTTNRASRRIFEKCGFEWISEHKGFALFRRPRRETV